MNEEVFRAVHDVLERGESAALVTIISTQGSTPQRIGAKMTLMHYAHWRLKIFDTLD